MNRRAFLSFLSATPIGISATCAALTTIAPAKVIAIGIDAGGRDHLLSAGILSSNEVRRLEGLHFKESDLFEIGSWENTLQLIRERKRA